MFVFPPLTFSCVSLISVHKEHKSDILVLPPPSLFTALCLSSHPSLFPALCLSSCSSLFTASCFLPPPHLYCPMLYLGRLQRWKHRRGILDSKRHWTRRLTPEWWQRGCGECSLVCSFVWRGFFGCVLELIVVCVWGVFLIWRCCAENPPFLGTRKFLRFFVIRWPCLCFKPN